MLSKHVWALHRDTNRWHLTTETYPSEAVPACGEEKFEVSEFVTAETMPGSITAPHANLCRRCARIRLDAIDKEYARFRLFMKMMKGPNPLEKAEILKLAEKFPDRYGFMKEYLHLCQ